MVHDGVLFVHSYGDNVQALNAVSGDELWHYARRLPEGTRPGTKRNIALFGNKLYFGASDLHVVALDIKTGNLVWDRGVAKTGERWNLTGGPLAAKGKIMQGSSGQGHGGAYIVALDSETGAEAWRFYTFARPDEPGGNTWNGLALEDRQGGSVWTAGSYDPELNLAFFGPAQTYDTGPLWNPVNRPGITNDALYTDTTIAINPETGKLVWRYQHLGNDQWDLDWAFERQVIRLPGPGGQIRKLIVTGGKPGVYDALDASTGKYAFSFDMGLQNFITAIDPVTGVKTVNPDLIPGTGKPINVCPSEGGRTELDPGRLQSRSKDPLCSRGGSLHGYDSGGAGWSWFSLDWSSRQRDAASGKRRALRPTSGDRPPNRRDGLDGPAACAADHRCTGHCRGPGVRGRLTVGSPLTATPMASSCGDSA